MKERPTAFLGKIGKIGWFFLRSKHNPNITLPGIPKVVPLLDLLEYNKAPNIWAVSRENGIPARVFWVDLNGILGSEVSEYFYLPAWGRYKSLQPYPKWCFVKCCHNGRLELILQDQNGTLAFYTLHNLLEVCIYLKIFDFDWMHFLNSLLVSKHAISCHALHSGRHSAQAL